MTKSPPTWLTRDAIACHPGHRICFEPQRLRKSKASDEFFINYTPESAFPAWQCRLAKPADLLDPHTTIYIAGQQYAKQVAGNQIRLSSGAKEVIIQLSQNACDMAAIASAFNGVVVPLNDAQSQWIDSLFQEPHGK